jgi:hypothetical protein
MATIPMIKKAAPMKIKKLPIIFFPFRQRKTPIIPSKSPNKDKTITISRLLYYYESSRPTRSSSATTGGSELCFTLNYLSRRSLAKADHLSTLNYHPSTESSKE